MARILEDYSLSLLQNAGLPVVDFQIAKNSEEAVAFAATLGGKVVIKALVPVGKRGKAGAVKFASGIEEVKQATTSLIGSEVRGYPVNKVLIAEKVEGAAELYLSISIDHNTATSAVVVSRSGGVDIEEVAEKNPEQIVTFFINPLRGLTSYEAIDILTEAGLSGVELRKVAEVLRKLYKLFVSLDATLLEINPLFVTEGGGVVIPACVLKVDDGALFRHPELLVVANEGSERAWRPLTDIERQVQAVQDADPYRGTARYTEFDDGNIGFMCGGGGGSLVLFDDLLASGGKPTNYTEFGGNPPEEKVYGLAKSILSKPGIQGLFVAHNITNNTQVDVEARGITRAIRDMGIDPRSFPIVVRAPGVNETEGQKIFKEMGIEFYGDDLTMTGSAKRMVEKLGQPD